MQQLSNRSFMIHNYNQEKTIVNIQAPQAGEYVDGFTGEPIQVEGKEIKPEILPRSRIWIRVN
jgi:hypothetical protein